MEEDKISTEVNDKRSFQDFKNAYINVLNIFSSLNIRRDEITEVIFVFNFYVLEPADFTIKNLSADFVLSDKFLFDSAARKSRNEITSFEEGKVGWAENVNANSKQSVTYYKHVEIVFFN